MGPALTRVEVLLGGPLDGARQDIKVSCVQITRLSSHRGWSLLYVRNAHNRFVFDAYVKTQPVKGESKNDSF